VTNRVGRPRGHIIIVLAFLPLHRFLPDRLVLSIKYCDADLLGKLLEQVGIEHAQTHGNLLAQLIGRTQACQREAPLAELLGAGQVAELLNPIGVKNILPGVETPAPRIIDGAKKRPARAESSQD
jgi:hypothetical protein